MWSDAKMNRLVKQIKDNAICDRESSKELLEQCKEAMRELGSRVFFDDEGSASVDAFTKLISAATQSLNQMGTANEKLLKLAQTMQKYQLKEMDIDKNSPAAKELNGSFFSNLTAMIDRDGKEE